MSTNLINLKYKKFHKNPISGKEHKINKIRLTKGSLGIKVLENARLSLDQIEALRFLLLRYLKVFETYWINIEPTITLTQKMGDIRMGKGKGMVIGFILKIKAGTILCEINIFRKNQEKLILQLKRLIKKLPLHCKITAL